MRSSNRPAAHFVTIFDHLFMRFSSMPLVSTLLLLAQILGSPRSEFDKLKQWKKNQLKKAAGLF